MSTENDDIDEKDLPEGAETDEVALPDDEHEDEATAKVDTELDEAETDEDRAAIQERRRAQKKNRAQRQRDKLDSMARDLASLREQNQTLQQQVVGIQNQNTGSQLAEIDKEIARSYQNVEHFKTIIARAVQAQDGSAVAEATQYMQAATSRAEKLQAFKNNATRAINAPPPLSNELVSRAQKFKNENPWYRAESTDEDSMVLTAIDNSLTAQGWDARTDAYWDELKARAAKKLGHRFDTPARPRNPVPGASSGGQSTGAAFTLSADRVQAMKDANLWDDPKTRKAQIDYYRKYDKEKNRG